MNHPDSVLGRIQSPADLKALSEAELEQLAAEMRSELIGVVGRRSAHFASNLGVVELCLALHLSFDFTQDRLIWDTGHQIYPHKLITGRAARLHTIRTKGGLMGYPNPAESPFDLFMTGHAGCAPSTALGLKVGDELAGIPDRHAVAVIGDGALPSGIVFEAFNHASGLRKKLLVILNDNKMSICPRVGGLADYLDRARMSSTYNDWNKRVKSLLPNIPLVGEHAERWLQQFKDAIKASLHHGMLFEELGFVYLGPIDGHDLKTLAQLPRAGQGDGRAGPAPRPDQQGARLRAGRERPGQVPRPGPVSEDGQRGRPAQDLVEPGVHRRRQRRALRGMPPRPQGRRDHRRHVRGEQAPEDPRHLPRPVLRRRHLREPRGRVRRRHGQGRRPAGRRHLQHVPPAVLRPDLPGSRAPEPAGRLLPRPRRPGRRRRADPPRRLRPGLSCASSPTWSSWPRATRKTSPRCSISPCATTSPVALRYPRANLETIEREVQPVELGQAEILEWETDGMLLACGAMVGSCLRVAERLHERYGLRVGVVNARFVKPLDRVTIGKAIEECGFVLTVEEGCLMGGFGSAVLEAANDAGLPTDPRPPARPARPLRAPRRARRAARRGRPRRRRHHPGGPGAGDRHRLDSAPSGKPTPTAKTAIKHPSAAAPSEESWPASEPFCATDRWDPRIRHGRPADSDG